MFIIVVCFFCVPVAGSKIYKCVHIKLLPWRRQTNVFHIAHFVRVFESTSVFGPLANRAVWTRVPSPSYRQSVFPKQCLRKLRYPVPRRGWWSFTGWCENTLFWEVLKHKSNNMIKMETFPQLREEKWTKGWQRHRENHWYGCRLHWCCTYVHAQISRWHVALALI